MKTIFSMLLAVIMVMALFPVPAMAADYTLKEEIPLTVLDPASVTTDQATVEIKSAHGYLVHDDTLGEARANFDTIAIAFVVSVTNHTDSSLQRLSTFELVALKNGGPDNTTPRRVYASDLSIDESQYGNVSSIPAGQTIDLILIRDVGKSTAISYDEIELAVTLIGYNSDMSKSTVEKIRLSMGSSADQTTITPPTTAPITAVTPVPTTDEPTTSTVNPTSSTVLINVENTAFEAYNIEGSNYFKLRDIAYVLNGTNKQFEVGYDNATKALTMTSDTPYTVTGSEMVPGDGQPKSTTPTASEIYLDGQELSFTVYNIAGSNFFKLVDLMSALDVGVTYNETTKNIGIDTSTGYTGVVTVQ